MGFNIQIDIELGPMANANFVFRDFRMFKKLGLRKVGLFLDIWWLGYPSEIEDDSSG